MQQIKISLFQLLAINKTNKDFVYFDLDNNNNLTAFKFSNEPLRYRNNFEHFRVTNIFKTEINKPKLINI